MVPVLDLFQMTTVLEIQYDPRAVDDDDDNVKIQIREYRLNSLSNAGFSREVVVRGNRRPKTVTATKFTSGCHYGGRPATLKVFVNDVYSGKILLPSDFVDNVKIVFNVGPNLGGERRLTSICGVPAVSSDVFTSFGVFNIFGPNAYEGRPQTCIFTVSKHIHRSNKIRPIQCYVFTIKCVSTVYAGCGWP